jgi:hypothetical protein
VGTRSLSSGAHSRDPLALPCKTTLLATFSGGRTAVRQNTNFHNRFKLITLLRLFLF